MVAPVQETPSEWLAFDIIAVSGDPVPGSSTAIFSSFPQGDEGPALNEHGSVAFRAVTSDGEGIFATVSGALTMVAHTGASAPDTGATFVGFRAPPNLNDRGDVVFLAELDGSAGLFAMRDGDLSTLVRLGDPVPGGRFGETFTAFEGAIPLLNNAGDVAFRGLFDGGQGIFVSCGEELRAVARAGQQVPDATAGETFDGFSLPVLNHHHEVAFTATFGGSSGIFVTRGPRLCTVVRTGQPVEGETFTGFSRPALNCAGDVAFSATFGASRGVFVTSGRQLHTVVQSADTLPGTTDSFLAFAGRPTLNRQGDVAFEASFFDGEVYIDALLVDQGRELTVIQQKDSGEPTLTSLVLSDQSEVAFVLSDFESRMFATSNKEPRFVAGSGGSLEIRPGEVRPLDRADLVSGEHRSVFAGNEDGLPSGFNNSGQIAFRAETGPSVASGNPGSAIVLATPMPGDLVA